MCVCVHSLYNRIGKYLFLDLGQMPKKNPKRFLLKELQNGGELIHYERRIKCQGVRCLDTLVTNM